VAIQKNFKIANGLEVNDNLIFADKDQNTVGIGTTVTQEKLQVIGGIGATDLVLSGVGTIPVLKSTEALISNGYINVGVITSLTGTAATITSVAGSVKLGIGTTALVVEGDARVTGILTVGTSSLTLNGETNQINGVTISAGIVTATTFSGDISLSDGSESAPSIKFSSSTTTGIYSPGSNQFGIATNGVARITIDASGNVVIANTLQVPLGSASAPSVFFAGDTNTGIYSPGADQFAIATNGAGRLFVDASGNVLSIGPIAVGTSNYSGSLVVQTASDTYIAFRSGAANVSSREARIQAISTGGGGNGHSLAFLTNVSGGSPTERLRITSAGNVGIGTTSPQVDFVVSNGGASGIEIDPGYIAGNSLLQAYNRSGAAFDTLALRAADFSFQVGGATERARIDSSGRILVGTSSARSQSGVTTRLQVEHTNYDGLSLIVNNNAAATCPVISLGKTRGSTNGASSIVVNGDRLGALLFHGADGTDVESGAATISAEVDGTPGANDMPGRLVFSTTADGASSPTERMRITSAGQIGIGGTPSEELHIFAPSGVYAPAEIGFTARNATNALLPFAKVSVAHAGAGASTSNLSIVTTDSSATSNEVATFYHDGSAALPFVYEDTVGATNRDLYIDNTGKLGYVSSIRASKANIATLANVDWLYQLEPVSFNRRKRDEDENYTEETYSELEYGLIAEDAELVNPELCFYDDVKGVQELRGVHYSKLIAPLLKAVQDLKTQNESLKARVAALETP
jgi:hypothetical protein